VIVEMNDSRGRFANSARPSRPSLFGISLPFRLSGHPEPSQPERLTVSQVKLHTELCFQEIEGVQADRLRLKVRLSKDVKELWMLRSDIHQLLSQHFNQSEASHRINSLLPCFVGWIPERQLVRI
jgi:hypothetical protein